MPIPHDEDDMRGEGWKKELIIKHVEVKGTTIYCEEWDFFAENHPCSVRDGGSGPKCGTDHVWVKCFNGKLFWCCWRHRICNGPISFDSGHKAKEYIVTATEAMDTCRDTGQSPPKELVGMFQEERVRKQKIGKYRRPENK